MMEDHAWAGDKRLIPPGGTLKPSIVIQGTLTHEAGEGVASSASASRNFERVMSKRKSHDIDNKVGNANAGRSQGAINEKRKEKIGNAGANEEQGAIIKKIGNADACEEQGAIIKKKMIGNANASGTQGAIAKKLIDNADANESQGAIDMMKTTGNADAIRTQGAISMKKKTISNVKASGTQDVIYCQCHDESERIEPKAKEGVGQSQICSELDPRMNWDPEGFYLFFILLSRAGYYFPYNKFS